MTALPLSGWLLWALLFAVSMQAFEPWEKIGAEKLPRPLRVIMMVEFVAFIPCALWLAYVAWRERGTIHLLKALLAFWPGGLLLLMVVGMLLVLPLKTSSLPPEEKSLRFKRGRYVASLISLASLFLVWFALLTEYRRMTAHQRAAGGKDSLNEL